eukprot:gene16111-18201_t
MDAEVENPVICSMDSSKDPSGRNSDFNLTGIQQILERKEGLFRRRMMGKLEEIGIPVRFTRESHYVTVVMDGARKMCGNTRSKWKEDENNISSVSDGSSFNDDLSFMHHSDFVEENWYPPICTLTEKQTIY